MTDRSAPQPRTERSVHAPAPEPFPIVAVVASVVVLLLWSGVNLWAQPVSDWIGALLSRIELYWLATRVE